MVELVKRWIQFQIKSIEFQIRTWKNAYKISKAYSSISTSTFKSFRLKNFLRALVLLVVITALLTGIVFGIIKLLKLEILKNPEAAIVSTYNEKQIQNINILEDKIKKKIDKEISKIETLLVDNDEEKHGDKTLETFFEESFLWEKDKIVRKTLLLDTNLFVYDSSARPISSEEKDFMIIVANKAMHALFLLQKDLKGNWKVVRTYLIAIGSQAGRKVTAGDKRTPEGLYIITERKEQHELSSIYGPLAYVLDYPNREDREEGRTGQGIWIHGTEKDSVPIETRGCLEMNNSDLKDLSLLLKSGKGTPVFIVNDSTLKNPVKIIDNVKIVARRAEFFDSINNIQKDFAVFVTEWVSAWESKNITEYSKYYHHSRFNSQGMDWEAWKEKKEKIFSLYDTIDVAYGKISLSDLTDSSAVLKFSQIYKTEKTRFENNKRLDLEKEHGIWKITKEAAF